MKGQSLIRVEGATRVPASREAQPGPAGTCQVRLVEGFTIFIFALDMSSGGNWMSM
jgi:hypothetical protein